MIQIAILAVISVASYFSPWVIGLYPFWIVYSIITRPQDPQDMTKLKDLENRIQALEIDKL